MHKLPARSSALGPNRLAAKVPPPAKLSFRPRARIIRTIGDRLISGPEAAVIELVRNAHDADAEWVRVTFLPPLLPGEGSIIVEDNGHGMTFSDVQTKWMEPATVDKVERTHSPGGRPLLGSRGIGRFAAAKLGRNLELKTTAAVGGDQNETTVIPRLDWDMFDKAVYLSDVEFDYSTGVVPNSEKHTGTALTITELRDQWTEISLRKLHAEMRRLISPLAEADKTNFQIYLDLSALTLKSCGFDGTAIVNAIAQVGAVPTELHRVRSLPLLKACDYEVEGDFDADGGFSGVMTIHRGDDVPRKFELEIPLRREDDEATCGVVLVHFFIFDREPTAIRETIRKAGLGDITTSAAREILNRASGVSIYRNGFRIRPYGDSEQDWLTLDKRRVQNPSMRIGNDQVAGIVVVDDEKRSGLVERSSREGLELNGSFRRLQRLLLTLFGETIEPQRYNFREGANLDRSKSTSFSNVHQAAQLRWTEQILPKLDAAARSEFQNQVAVESARLERFISSLEQRQGILEARATIGQIIDEVIHEGRPPVAFIQDETSRLSRWWTTLFDNTAEARRRRDEDVPQILRGLNGSAERLRTLFNALSPLSGQGRGRQRVYSPTQIILDTFFLFRSRLGEYGIEHSVASDPHIPDINGYPNDLAAALANLLDNSIYWLQAKKTAKPLIEVRATKADKQIEIIFSDNGPGIPAEFFDRVFEVGFTLRPSGTGLGLSIAQEALGRSGGQIRLRETEGPGVSFLITLPILA